MVIHALQDEAFRPAAPVEGSTIGIVDMATAIRRCACNFPINGKMTRYGAN
jgi:hypothetical protein